MTTVRKVDNYSTDPGVLAREVAMLARDVRDGQRIEVAGPFRYRGVVRLPFGLDVGGRKPLLLVATYTDQETEYATLASWKWRNGEAQVQSLAVAPSSGTSVTLTFFALREAG
jgi:hypothetical protein